MSLRLCGVKLQAIEDYLMNILLIANRLTIAAAIVALYFAAPSQLIAQVVVEQSQVTRHPMEIRALVDPEGVLKELPAQLKQAETTKNYKEVALLYLAQSNACRVIADWKCQSMSAAKAHIAAEKASLPELQIRSLIAESRGDIAMQEFSHGEELLGDAERLLSINQYPELNADVFLAYSSLSYSLGKNELAADYAGRGLKALANYSSPPIRIRLLRNQARALSQLNKTPEAEALLNQAMSLSKQIQDPKLTAELYVEIARIARAKGDVATQVASGQQILELAKQLSNSQVTGLAHEVLGLAARSENDNVSAEIELRLAQKSFQELKLYRDERRVLRSLLSSMIGRDRPRVEMEQLTARLIELGLQLESDDRRLAADDFDARLKYAQQKFDLDRLQANAALTAERENAAANQRRFITLVAILSIGLLIVMGILFLLQRRFSTKLQQVITQLRDSEFRYRTLAENSRDLVVRMRPDGRRLYVSPAVKDMLGFEPEQLLEPRWDLVHPDDVEKVTSALKNLGDVGGSATIVYRARHSNGEYIWIEALARLVPHPEDGGPPEIIYSGRDVSIRIKTQQALSLSESRMRAITDNIPALIAHIDKDQRYLFANALIGKIFGIEPKAMIGHTMREMRGEAIYADLEVHIDDVLRGNIVSFEGSNVVAGKKYFYQSNYVPDLDANNDVQGFFALTFDITALKVAEADLDRLTRIDSLTGVANRRQFDEQLSATLARSRRTAGAVSPGY